MFQARSLSHEYYLPAEFLTIAAIMYYFSAAPLEQLVNYLEGKARAKIAR